MDRIFIKGKVLTIRQNKIAIQDENQTYTLTTKIPFTLAPGDAISGTVLAKNGDLFIDSPIAFRLGEDRDTLFRLLSKTTRSDPSRFISRLLEDFGNLKEIFYYLDSICETKATNWPPHYREFFESAAEHWHSVRNNRMLHLFGISEEISIRPKPRHTVDLYSILTKNPTQIYSLGPAIWRRINTQFRLSISELDFSTAKIPYIIYNFEKERQWTGIPKDVLQSKFSAQVLEESIGRFGLKQRANLIQCPELYHMETSLAFAFCKLKTRQFDQIPAISKIHLSEEQNRAVQGALTVPISIISGGAGTGKTTILKTIIECLTLNRKTFFLTSFTGKAVARMVELTGQAAQASTMHYALAHFENLKNISCVIIDEVSMITTTLMHKWIQKFGLNYRVIFVGDINQLEPIDAGNLLSGLLPNIPLFKLTKNFRSEIVLAINVQNILRGEKITPAKSFVLVQERWYGRICQIIDKLHDSGLKRGDYVILSPFNTHVDFFNNYVQNKLGGGFRMVDRNGAWRLGDKVRCSKNDYTIHLSNGEEGTIIKLDSLLGEITVEFSENKTIVFGVKNRPTSMLRLNYALTIHMAQGSEWDNVILHIPVSHNDFLNKNLIYTAVTRAKKWICVAGDLPTFEKAITREPKQRMDGFRAAFCD